jgi:acyl carrier protein
MISTTDAVHAAVLEVAQMVQPEATSVADEQRLREDLNFGSLDLAQLVAMLEIKLGVDPFAQHTALTSIATVGDLCRVYDEVRKAAGAGEDG